MKIRFKRPDGGISIATAAPKEALERIFGPMTDQQYKAHVFERLIPKDATDIIEIPMESTERGTVATK